MRTTLDVPDELFRKVKAQAALEGLTLKELLTRYVEAGVNRLTFATAGSKHRSELPVIRKKEGLVPDLTPEIQARLEEEEDFAKLDRSFGR